MSISTRMKNDGYIITIASEELHFKSFEEFQKTTNALMKLKKKYGKTISVAPPVKEEEE